MKTSNEKLKRFTLTNPRAIRNRFITALIAKNVHLRSCLSIIGSRDRVCDKPLRIGKRIVGAIKNV